MQQDHNPSKRQTPKEISNVKSNIQQPKQLESLHKQASEIQSSFKAVFNFDKRLSFRVDPHYEIEKIVGRGSLGVVAKGKNKNKGQEVAIKMIMDLFQNPWEAKRELREIKILKFLKHKNIVELLDIMSIEDPESYNQIYLVLEYFPGDLKKIIRSEKKLSEDMIKFILFQILDAIHFMHSAGLIHRDLKPENILINKNLRLKITDMNLARNQQEGSTKYVVSRPYRAPQLILSSKGYNKSIDIWSIGCIFAELLGGTMLFQSENCLEQFQSFVAILGKPEIGSFVDIDPKIQKQFKQILKEVNDRPKVDWKTIYQNVNDKALDLLDKMLVYDPAKRYTAEQCLNHPYLEDQRKKFPIRKCSKTFDFSFDDILPESGLVRKAIWQQVQQYHGEKGGEKRKKSPLKCEGAEQMRKQIKKQ